MAILVYYIDDEQDLLEVFSDIFSSDEVEISVFRNEATLLEAIKNRPPQLIFFDYRLQTTTGDVVALKIDSSIPKALVSGDLSLDLKCEFNAVFRKPFEIEKISNYISTFLK